MKKQIRVHFLDSFPKELTGNYINYLASESEVICDPVNYDYLFAMETLYHNRENLSELFRTNPEAVRIMVCGEAIYPDLNLFDYAVCNENMLSCEDRVIQYPRIAQECGNSLKQVSDLDESKKGLKPEDILKEKTKFCNFMYSNALAHPMRDKIFYALSLYKHVDSLGKHLKNVDIPDTRNIEGWAKIGIGLKKPYKFTIAVENGIFNGNTTEKMLTSMLANTVPIYFGNPAVGELYNPKSFINVHDFASLDELTAYVQKVDEDDALWCEIMAQPWRTPVQIEKTRLMAESFLPLFRGIFTQPIEKAKHRPRGTWHDTFFPNLYLYGHCFGWKGLNVLSAEDFDGIGMKRLAQELLKKIFKRIGLKK